jgi:hypothetical protein
VDADLDTLATALFVKTDDLLKGSPTGAPGGVIVRVLQRILALTAAIWHNDHTGQPIMRSLTAYDH